MGNNSVPKFIFRLSRFPVYRGSVLGRFYCINIRQYTAIEMVRKKTVIQSKLAQLYNTVTRKVDCVWNVMAHAQKPDFVFRPNGRVHLNRRGRQFSRLLATEVCASVVVMLDTPCSEVVWRVLTTHSIRQFPLHFPSRASPCAITFQLDFTYTVGRGFLSLLTEARGQCYLPSHHSCYHLHINLKFMAPHNLLQR